MAPVKDSYEHTPRLVEIVLDGDVIGHLMAPWFQEPGTRGFKTPDGILNLRIEEVFNEDGLSPIGLCADVTLDDAEKLFDCKDYSPI